MSNPETTSLLHRRDTALWIEAIQAHNAGVKHGSASKKFIHLDKLQNHTVDANTLISVAHEVYKGLDKKRGRFATCLVSIWHLLHRHAKSIDVFIQSRPELTSLIWGSIAEEEERACCIAGEGILEILRHLGRWEQAAAISDLLSSEPVQRAIVILYTKVLDFLVSATLWLKRSKLSKIGATILSAKGEKFDTKLKNLREASEFVDTEIQTRYLTLLQTVNVDVQSTMNKLDQGIAQAQQLSNTSQLREVKEWLLKATIKAPLPGVRVKGTCQWLLEHPIFIQWHSQQTSPTLWVEGLPGRGKSVTAAFLRQYLSNNEERVAFYAFHRSSSVEQSTPSLALASLMAQLLETSGEVEPRIITALAKLSSQFPLGPVQCPFDQIEPAAVLIFNSEKGFSIVLDAVDECTVEHPSSHPGALQLFQFFDKVLSTADRKIAVFSRPDPRFQSIIRSCITIQLSGELLLPDVMSFSEAEYRKLDLPDTEIPAVMDCIRSTSQGSFWWTRLFLEHLHGALDMPAFCDRLCSPVPSIHQYYLHILQERSRDLDKSQQDRQISILALTFHAQRVLTVDELADAVSIWPKRASEIISQLCQPLISTLEDVVQFSHPTVREFFESSSSYIEDLQFRNNTSRSHSIAVEKSLLVLLRRKYADTNSIEWYLNWNMDQSKRSTELLPHTNDGFYDYAARYWHVHLCKIKTPSESTLQILKEFLVSLQYAHWSQYSAAAIGHMIGVIGPLDQIKLWAKELPAHQQDFLNIENSYSLSYMRLIEAYGSLKPMNQCLARLSICGHLLNLGQVEEQAELRTMVSTTLRSQLPIDHPISLRNRADLAYSMFLCGKLRDARAIYSGLVEVYHGAYGDEDVRFTEALHYRGESEYLMAEFGLAFVTLTKSVMGFMKARGPDSWSYIAANLWYGRNLAHLGKIEAAIKIWGDSLQKRLEDHGIHDGLTTRIRIGLADLLRFTCRTDEAIIHLQKTLRILRASRPLTDISRLDAEILLAKAYKESKMSSAAWAIVYELENDGCLKSHFKRSCQVEHLKGLLLDMDGFLDDAIMTLSNALIKLDRDQNNLALLWARLDLADMLRRRGAEGDINTATVIFEKLVKGVSESDDPWVQDEPDSPKLLSVAEKALRMIRSGQHIKARELLQFEEMNWICPSDLWLWYTDAIFI
ncbi:unnamed protein product [Clonostachys rhizophaga]|uniref:NACHT domain-containing protein n=1 Tax=Clonostachys rhizophaga TaxID=160324 RepID=A0A9N9YJF5_9HYPO|nr:unnamed protein product [Clonostachys rhizophaga]